MAFIALACKGNYFPLKMKPFIAVKNGLISTIDDRWRSVNIACCCSKMF